MQSAVEPPRRTRRTARAKAGFAGRTGFAGLLSLLLAAVLVTGCSDGSFQVQAIPAAGWPTYGGDPGNANFTPATVPDGVELAWNRSMHGTVATPLTITGNGDVGVTTGTLDGCNLFVLDNRAGRKNFCKRMRWGTSFNAPAFDQWGNPYIGEETTFLAFTGDGSIRWRMPVIGVPLSAKFAGAGRVLMVTTQGQILLLNAQNHAFEAPEVRLWPNADGGDPRAGFADCGPGGPGCAVSAPPAVDPDRDRFYLNFRPEGGDGAVLRAMSYGETDDGRVITERWSTPVPGGMAGPATVSADGQTVYAFGRDGSLRAYSAEDGAQRWSHDLGGVGFATLTASPDGILIPTGAEGSPLTILKDAGDRAEVRAKRDDLQVVSLSALTGGDAAWTVVRSGPNGPLSLTEIATADGATRRSLDLPGATGFTTGVAVSARGNVAVATHAGEVYYFSRG